MTVAPDTLLLHLRQCVGADQVLTGPGLERHEVDWRRRYHGRAAAVVRPGSAAEVAAVLRCCAQHGVSVVPQGGNTGLVGGGVPDASGRQVVLSTQRLNRLRQLDVANLTLTVEAGMVLSQVQQLAQQQGLWFPLSLASEGSCTVGGNLATNAGGTQVLRFGNARDLCLGLEVVTPQGELVQGLSGLRKDNTGYDLRHLYVGSEGTLGIITAATLKLFPQPAAQLTALATCHRLSDAVALLEAARRALGSTLTAFELMNAASRQLVARHVPELQQPLWDPAAPPAWTLLMEQADEQGERQAQARLESLLSQAVEAGWVQDAVVAQNLRESARLWQLRESIPLAQAAEGLNIKHDIALPVSAIPAFVEHSDACLQQAAPGCRMVTFGHLGDGNLHYNIQAPEGEDAARFLEQQEERLNALVYDAVQARGGSVSAEHGIGQLKRDELPRRKDPISLAVMHRIKQALDPQGLMNPGRLL